MTTGVALWRLEDGGVLDDIADNGLRGAGSANNDQWLGGEIDVFLVLHVVRRDGFVAQFAELDTDFIRCSLVGAAAHGSPVGFQWRQPACRSTDLIAKIENGFHLCGQLQQGFDLIGDELARPASLDLGDFQG